MYFKNRILFITGYGNMMFICLCVGKAKRLDETDYGRILNTRRTMIRKKAFKYVINPEKQLTTTT